jgi:hypothetical protein
MWQQWVNAILGLAVIATPFVGLSADTLLWALAIEGAAVAVLAVWGAMRSQSREYHQYMLSHSM